MSLRNLICACVVGLATSMAAAGATDMPASAPADLAVRTADEIRAEALRANDDPIGRPLPLAANWNTGSLDRRGFHPDWQMEAIAAGHHLLPWFQLNAPWWQQIEEKYYVEATRRAAELRLPITLEGTQFEAGLTADKKYFNLPADRNPNVVTADGKVLKMVSPFGPVEPWTQLGQEWTRLPAVAKMQQLYPNPPRVIFLSNNEHSKLTWRQAERSKRYIDQHGKGRDDAFKRQAVASGWIERYRALQAGMRQGLTAMAWRDNAIFVGYDAFGPPHLARWGGWVDYSLWTPGRIDPSPLIWDGGSPSFYVHNWNPSTDHTVWSPQVESSQWPFMIDDALKLNPSFWWEISVWDGHEPKMDNDMRKTYARAGQEYGPTRYRGMVQLGMWMLRPRVVREFRGWIDYREQMLPYFSEVMASIDRLYRDPTLARFWRKGELVANPNSKHPYQENLPEEFAGRSRWFLLDNSALPPRPWKLDTKLPVFAVALQLGQSPRREWLIYAHAPLGDRRDVQIELPGFGPVKADVAVGGTFLLVSERDKSVRAIEPPPQQ